MRGKTEKNDARGNEGLRPLYTGSLVATAVFTIRRLSFLSLKHTHMDVDSVAEHDQAVVPVVLDMVDRYRDPLDCSSYTRRRV